MRKEANCGGEEKCPLCESKEIVVFSHIEEITFFECSNCRLVFADKGSRIKEDNEVYNEKYTIDRGHLDNPHIEMIKKKGFYYYLKKIPLEKNNNKLLEIGCSSGMALEVSQEMGWQPTGIDINNAVVEITRHRIKNVEVKSKPLVKCRFPDQYFSAVIMLDVIEHIPDPVPLIEEVSRILKKNGIILILTPNIQSFSARVLKNKWPHFLKEHIIYYSPETLQRLLARFGIVPIESGWAGKYVSPDMIGKHCELHRNIFGAGIILKILNFFPEKLKKAGVWFNIGEMYLYGKKL